MRRIALAALLLLASAGGACADLFNAPEWYRRIEGLTRSLIGPAAPDHDVITPPGNIDPKMALTPPMLGTMRIIPPPGPSGR